MSEEILPTENEVLRKTITIINKLGLHARASAKLVRVSSYYTSDIKIRCDEKIVDDKPVKTEEKIVDGKSIMGIMMLAASKGVSLEIIACGEDAADAIKAITELVNNRFDESE